jgi:predicted metalloprotease
MDLGDQRASSNIEDRRGIGLGGGLGIGGVVIAIIAAFLGFDPGEVLNTVNSVEQAAPPRAGAPAPREGVPEDPTGQFVAKVLGSTEDVWGDIFRASGSRYRTPRLVLYTGATRSACGTGQAAMGPFYCPNDQRVYLDLAFFNDLQRRFRAPGDFAEAYVIAHEIGHHVQNLNGGFRAMQQEGPVGRGEHNRASVQLELQADCYAGVWAYHAAQRHQLVPGDVEEALTAAAAVGDDRLQRESQGYIVPESFTHGSSAQRVRWFKRGMARGQVADCDTAGAAG